ncbi:GNAT family N-acetyltransferase [Uliginosibacterium sp. H3]|uniref:GNAT family N-acetyltransferase n=1 Tax=Uliginosibacterium silvisoli TaxID=3114758 RepID=A0ABU6K7W4_9RHOO|nr:GNAT family N-acetyltransferase [Uliginosibacterium sp. H3]
MDFTISPNEERHFASLHAVLDVVAREQRYLAFVQAPPFEQSLVFYRNIIARDLCQFVALEADELVGWCDILPVMGESRAHIGTLGIGLLPRVRGKGLGRKLLDTTIAKAWHKGLTRIELSVRVDNPVAIALYERIGFQHEGTRRNASLIAGRYCDTYAMALLNPA